MISNWTGHVKKCFNAKSSKTGKQQTISQFLSLNNAKSPVKSLHVNKESAAQQCMPSGTLSSNLSPSHEATSITMELKSPVKSLHVNKESAAQQNMPSGTLSSNLSPSHEATSITMELDKPLSGYVTHVNTLSPTHVTTNTKRELPANFSATDHDLTCTDESNQLCFLQASPVRVNQERL